MAARIDIGARATHVGTGGPTAPVVYVVDLPYHGFDLVEVARGRHSTIVRLPVRSWDDSLTPWPAPGVRRGGGDFGGHAAETLAELVGEALPAVEEADGLRPACRAICGYSLAGLFALYAFASAPAFAACASLSGSLWYEGWVGWLRARALDGRGRYAYLSVGSRERKAPQRVMRRVEDATRACGEALRARGCVVDVVVGPGDHFHHVQERFDAGIGALDRFLAR